MKSLDEIVALFEETRRAARMERYLKFEELSKKVDDFATMLLYNNKRIDTTEQRHAYAMLAHNAINGFCTARNFTKNQFSDIPFRHRDDTPYTAEEVQAVIDRNDAVAVQNYTDIINLFTKLVEQLETA
jgi:hypothetical protein